MAQERPVTPEKQLLKLIEEPKASKHANIQAHAIKHHNLSLFSFGAWLGRISFSKDRFGKWFNYNKQNQIDIKLINSILELATFILAVYFVYNFYHSVANLKKMPNLTSKVQDEQKLNDLGGAAQGFGKSISYHLEKVRQRDIFKMGASTTPEPVIKGISSKIIEVTQDLKLVGISWSDDPDAIIEDTKATRTFFIKRGQMIGEVKVQAIFKDKIILRYQDEEIELR